MQQVKIFKGLEPQIGELEAQINEWIKSSGARVIQITGNVAPQSHEGSAGTAQKTLSGGSGFAPSDVVVILLYELP